MATCPNCGSATSEGAVFCDQCGTRLSQPAVAAPEGTPMQAGGGVICPTCNAGNVPGEPFCAQCGSPLEAPEPEGVPEPVSGEAEPEVATAAPVETPAVVQAEGLTCQACGTPAAAGEAFCANCGASLTPTPPEPEPVTEPEPVDEPEPVAAVEPAEPEPAQVQVLTCAACGAEAAVGDVFCSTCGSPLQAGPVPVDSVPAGPRLVVVDSGAEIPLPAGAEILVGREDPVSGIFPEIDLTPHGGDEGGVSRHHAKIVLEGASYFVEDLDSTNFTFVNKQRLTPGVRQPVADGDQIRFGRVAVVLKTGA